MESAEGIERTRVCKLFHLFDLMILQLTIRLWLDIAKKHLVFGGLWRS